MKKWIGWAVAIILGIGAGAGGFVYYQMSSKVIRLTPETLKKMNEAVAAQNEDAIKRPPVRKLDVQPPNPLKNVYFGDTHVHTSLSFDSYLFGNRLGLEEAYRFAKGEPLRLKTGETMQLYRPLDFIAVTDHAESFGIFEACDDPSLNEEQKEFCRKFETPSLPFFVELKSSGIARPPKRVQGLCQDNEFCFEHGKTTWAKVRQMADKYNQPGLFTAFQAYEYSPMLKKNGMVHRNVIFRNSIAPDAAFSLYEAPTVTELWQALETHCTGGCEFLTIPHNMNFSWGVAYSGKTIDGDAYTKEDWALRGRSEPLAEIFQIKGNSECGVGAGSVDEECGFEQFWPVCGDGDTVDCVTPDSFAREGLKKGLELEGELGFNPLRFGFVGSTDTHNANAGDTEEFDWRGQNGVYASPAEKRLSGKLSPRKTAGRNPGGLAAVWAVENTRDALFDSMEKREAYATSGTRIRLRFFGGWDLDNEILNSPDMVSRSYEKGVPMGSVLNRENMAATPKFIVWAAKDPDAANLQRVQMVKGWVEKGKRREKVVDIACSNGLRPDPSTGRCPDNGAFVDLDTCRIPADAGNAEIKTIWEDKDFNPDHAAFYYVRVLENPTCRWSTYDAIRLGQKPREDLPPTVKERAWSSPIWYSPDTDTGTVSMADDPDPSTEENRG
ncbi:MAG: DUF3604 domain-containing protein [Desulfobacterales bacterium]|nr:DUF3604 domain-containing protein [Desulfobacterales bacterium]